MSIHLNKTLVKKGNQVDAHRLDIEMSAMLKEQLVNVFSLMKPGFLFQYEPELDAFEFLIWRFSIWVDKPNPGNALMNLSTVTEVRPSLNDSTDVQFKSISNATLSSLAKGVLVLKEDKKQRLHKLEELATQLIDLWNLMVMDAPQEERSLFDPVTHNISAAVDEVTIPGALALDLIEQEIEFHYLAGLKVV
ncbi:hypothetical protein RHMOL_Rhmol01G0249600 [Rhododendron molle]|uniref:Uncharacterized protein n=1 Tax=Rhododendron molle TaxID=49168 RepID=A0ACC0Q6J0_RHOML|nr:hypothetical protein RHMOL_Rhmol01G0249600 [Rhododendron molle]